MTEKRGRISDGATLEDIQALLLKCSRQLRSLMPAGADLSRLDHIEAEVAWQACIETWIAGSPERRNAIFYGSDQCH
jgi:hypothetical protein